MREEDVEREVQEFLAGARELGLEPNEDLAREKVRNMLAEAEEHDVSLDDIQRRNLIRGLFGGGARP